jgi:hypothetical protein
MGRRGVICVLAMAAVVATWAQRRPPQGPRALAIVEWREGAKEPTLVPLTIMENGAFYDASFYRVRSQPMALEPGTVYEVTRAGEPVGLFTVNNAERREREWVGSGRFRAKAEEKEKPAASEVVVPGARSDDDEPPKLRKPKKQEEAPIEGAAQNKKEETAAPDSADDPDRPRLRRGAPSPSPTTTPAAAPEKPASPTGENKATTSAAAAKAGLPGRALLAVSDAKAPESRPYAFQWRPEEEQNIRRQAAAMAEGEIAKAAKLAKPALRLQDIDLRAFDLDYDNAADVVMTARAAIPQGSKAVDHYILLVARMNIEGKLDKVFAAVSDDAHPEFTERYELVDVADADGDGRGDLVFRKWTGKQRSFVVYRYFRDSLYRLFESRGVTPAA